MDAVAYLKERKRMCDSHTDENGVLNCDACLVEHGRCWASNDRIDGWEEEAVRVVEEWSMEHPVMTNAMKFAEVFGVMPAPDACPPTRKHYCKNYNCADCLEWWDEPYMGE